MRMEKKNSAYTIHWLPDSCDICYIHAMCMLSIFGWPWQWWQHRVIWSCINHMIHKSRGMNQPIVYSSPLPLYVVYSWGTCPRQSLHLFADIDIMRVRVLWNKSIRESTPLCQWNRVQYMSPYLSSEARSCCNTLNSNDKASIKVLFFFYSPRIYTVILFSFFMLIFILFWNKMWDGMHH